MCGRPADGFRGTILLEIRQDCVMTKALRQLEICGAFLFLVHQVHVSAQCRMIYSVAEIASKAISLDGQIVCVKGMVAPMPIAEWDSARFVHELLPLPGKKASKAKDSIKLGLVEWSPETGISEKQYNADSFDLLEAGWRDTRSTVSHALNVTLRALLMYKKNLLSKVPPLIPPAPRVDLAIHAQYDIELVVLEILNVRQTARLTTDEDR